MLTGIEFVVHVVDCDARFLLAGSLHSLMHMMSVHTLTAVLRQQGWVNVNDTLWISIYHIIRNTDEATCKDDEIASFHSVHDKFAVLLKLLASDYAAWYSMILGTCNCVGISLVADNNRNFYIRIVLEVIDDILQVGTASTNQDCQFCYFIHILITHSKLFLQIGCKITKISAVSTQITAVFLSNGKYFNYFSDLPV